MGKAVKKFRKSRGQIDIQKVALENSGGVCPVLGYLWHVLLVSQASNSRAQNVVIPLN